MTANMISKRVVIAQLNNVIIVKVDGHTVMTMGHVEAMSFGEAMYKVGADIKMKESMK